MARASLSNLLRSLGAGAAADEGADEGEGVVPSASALAARAAAASSKVSSIDKVERNGVFEGIRVKVYLWNEDERSLVFGNVDVSAKQVCAEMAKKEQLRPESVGLFSLWLVGNELELQLKPDQDLFEIVDKFPRYVEKYTHYTGLIRWRFVYKREAMVTKERDRKVKDPNAIRLLYVEAAHNVITSRYPLPSETDAIALAGILMQIRHGSHAADVHRPGFMLNSGGEDKLREYIPRHYVSPSFLSVLTGRAIRPAEWEERILAEHKKHAGKPPMIAQLLYLQYVRQYPFYGSVFFTACSEVPPRGFFEQRTETLHVGVNAEGIQIIDADNTRLVRSFLYDDINWDYTRDTFIVEVGEEGHLTDTTLVTPQSSLIASLVGRAIKNLNRRDQRLAVTREQQERNLRDELASSP